MEYETERLIKRHQKKYKNWKQIEKETNDEKK